MKAGTLLLFGDQSAEILDSTQELAKIANKFTNVQKFLQTSIHLLRREISQLPRGEKDGFPNFNSLLELATIATEQDCPPALRAALLCLTQLGHLIAYAVH